MTTSNEHLEDQVAVLTKIVSQLISGLHTGNHDAAIDCAAEVASTLPPDRAQALTQWAASNLPKKVGVSQFFGSPL